MLSYPQFNLVLASMTLTSLISVGLVNLTVDPYGVIDRSISPALSRKKPAQASHARLFKAIDITHIKPKTVILGTSKADFGLDPDHPALMRYRATYNLALPDSNMYEQLRYFQHALANQPDLELVIIDLDFISFSRANKTAPGFDEKRLGNKSLTATDFLNVGFSLSALNDSIETVESNSRHDSTTPYNANGMRNAVHFKQKKSMHEIFREYLQTYLQHPELYRDYALSTQQLDNLKAVVETCRQQGVEVKLFISPYHATQLEAIHAAGLWSTFEDWKRQVAAIAPVWDFSGYNSITTEPISDSMHYFRDSVHYQAGVGNLMIDRIMNYQSDRIPQAFGVLLTPDSIEADLAKTRQAHQQWTASNPDLVELIERLKQD